MELADQSKTGNKCIAFIQTKSTKNNKSDIALVA